LIVVNVGLVQAKARRQVLGAIAGTRVAGVVRVKERRARRSEVEGAGGIGIARK
jgi:hypothetical protein